MTGQMNCISVLMRCLQIVVSAPDFDQTIQMMSASVFFSKRSWHQKCSYLQPVLDKCLERRHLHTCVHWVRLCVWGHTREGKAVVWQLLAFKKHILDVQLKMLSPVVEFYLNLVGIHVWGQLWINNESKQKIFYAEYNWQSQYKK